MIRVRFRAEDIDDVIWSRTEKMVMIVRPLRFLLYKEIIYKFLSFISKATGEKVAWKDIKKLSPSQREKLFLSTIAELEYMEMDVEGMPIPNGTVIVKRIEIRNMSRIEYEKMVLNITEKTKTFPTLRVKKGNKLIAVWRVPMYLYDELDDMYIALEKRGRKKLLYAIGEKDERVFVSGAVTEPEEDFPKYVRLWAVELEKIFAIYSKTRDKVVPMDIARDHRVPSTRFELIVEERAPKSVVEYVFRGDYDEVRNISILTKRMYSVLKRR